MITDNSIRATDNPKAIVNQGFMSYI